MCVLDHADCTAPTRQPELDHTDHTDHADHTDHTDHTDQEYACPAWYFLVMTCSGNRLLVPGVLQFHYVQGLGHYIARAALYLASKRN